MLPGYRDPRTYMPEGEYPKDWPPIEKIHSPDWRQYRSPAAPEWLNATEVLLDRHVQNGDTAKKTAIIADDISYSYEQLLRMICKVANALTHELGLDYDHRIAIFAPDRIEAMVTWLGAHRAGVVPCWLSHLYKTDDIRYFIEDLACKAVFVDASRWDNLRAIRDKLPPTLKHIVVYGENGKDLGVEGYDQLVHPMQDQFLPVKKHVDDFSYLFYSGGTTGRAKCIVHLVRDFTWIPHAFVHFMEWKSSDMHYDTSPKFHDHGIWPGALIPLWNGATTIFVSDRLTADVVVNTIEKHQPNILTTVPTVLKWLINYPSEQGKKPDLSSLKMVHSAAEKIPMVMYERFQEFYGIEIFDSVGSSEITYEWFANRPKEHKMGSGGKPIFGYEALLVDPETFEIIREANRHGEMWVRSDSVLFFYWRKYHKTKDSLVGPWMRTGDVMYFDEDGFIWHVGRLDDVFKVSGMWVSPLQVESSLLKSPAVRDVAVIPKKDESDGLTYTKAFVVLSPGCTLSNALIRELQEMVGKEIGSYKAPKWIEAIDEIPRTTFQKISRVTLRQREETKEAAPTS
ncbi:MAG: AMP-binding protein [Acidobacteria bacterium]|nr:AMP-binding protein [Acidobacteriota bacterium]